MAAHGVTTLYYVVARARGKSFAQAALTRFLDVFRIAAVDGIVIKRALDMRWKDFEYAVTACAAEAAGCDVLVTRDPAGFEKSPVRVLDPRAAVAWLTRR